jgi:hypothetical protein
MRGSVAASELLAGARLLGVDSMHRSLRAILYEQVSAGRFFLWGISALILLNVGFAAMMSDKDQNGKPDYTHGARLAYLVFEIATCIIFTLEYSVRLWTCVEALDGVQSAWARCGLRCGAVSALPLPPPPPPLCDHW